MKSKLNRCFRGIIIFLFSISNSNAQTVINDSLVYGTWTKANSPYEIYRDIYIPDDSTLTIEPGVTVEFQGHYKIVVKGRINSQGTSDENILFTINDTTPPNITASGPSGTVITSTINLTIRTDETTCRYIRNTEGDISRCIR